ncbi:hypothetical protein [Aquimarina sediminis]|uniref:hypothetical protein n=1 Tax=Aquimarina sediminis TaxID=2070536 RepID=UPI000CA02280|nr:hypothetical protein [Aquimarina sediminis]
MFDRSGGRDIGPVITEIPQDYAIGDPLMHSSPTVSGVFTSGGVAYSAAQINSVSQMIQGIATIFTDPLSLFTWDTYLGAVSQGLGSVFPTLKTFRTNAEIQRAAATGDINNVFYTLGGIHVDVLTETSSIIPALRGAKVASTAGKAASTTKRLQSHVTRAAKKVDALGDKAFTRGQRRALKRNPYLRPAFRGNRIDVKARRMIENDSKLNNLQSNYNRGPDFVDPATGNWWDMTTPGSWSSHVKKYGPGGTFLNTQY